VLRPVRIAVLEIVTVVWLVFAISYTGRGPAVSRPLLAGLAAFTALVIAGFAFSSVVPDLVLPVIFAANFTLQSTTLALGTYGLFVAGRSVVVYDDLPTGGTALVTVLGAGFVCLSVLVVVENDATTQAFSDVSIGIVGLMTLVSAVVVHRYRVFVGGASAGHLARQQVFDELTAAVVILDRSRRVLDCNAAFTNTFGVGRRETIGRSITAVIPSLTDGRAVPLTTTDGTRLCDVDRTGLTADDGTPIGEAYRIRDVTGRETREQRLDVLNRVLRHNLRNDLDAIHAFAETLERDSAGLDPAAIGTRIGETARDLSDIGATLRRSEQLLRRDQLDRRAVQPTVVAREVRDRLTDRYPGTVAVHAETTRTVHTDRELLTAILTEVVENGLEHGPGADADVAVVIDTGPTAVEIAVHDNGPGIPEQERAVLVDGEESQLRHGSGVGLWLVDWGLSRLGGELSFGQSERGGSVVTLTVPD
jgi:Signal transduction histidine kinase